MEDMGPVLVKVNALHFFSVDIAGDMIPLVNNQHRFPSGFCLLRKNRAVEACADDQVIIHFRSSFQELRLLLAQDGQGRFYGSIRVAGFQEALELLRFTHLLFSI